MPLSPPPLTLYIHFPWCIRKCPYCDFNSHTSNQTAPEVAYIQALINDLEQELPMVWGRKIRSIFFGGGTPSLFAPTHFDTLLSVLRARLPLLPQLEITLEANPGTVESGRFAEFHAIGINRLSLGVQSFDNAALQRLGRIHNGNEARTAIEIAQMAGFNNLNLDLMFGLPQQHVDTALSDLRTATAYQPAHLSWYQLTIEPNTAFYRQPPPLPDDNLMEEIQIAGQAWLAEQGYQLYEISAYARTQRCQHNINYWQFGDYLGIGAGAHGKITLAAENTIVRYSKQANPQRYLDTAHNNTVMVEQHHLSAEDVFFEFMLNNLRLRTGFSENLFIQRTGLPLNYLHEKLAPVFEKGWLRCDNERILTTEQGWRFLNEVLMMLM